MKNIEEIQEFEKNGGIFQPIRAIVRPSCKKQLIDVIKECNHISVVHDRLSRGCEAAKEQWTNLVNKSSVIGYFAAIKNDHGDVIVSYSVCKPEDWKSFNKNISKKIAIKKESNKHWVVDSKGFCIELYGKPQLSNFMRNAPWTGAMGYEYLMLGTFMQQFMYFLKRVRKYYKLGQ